MVLQCGVVVSGISPQEVAKARLKSGVSISDARIFAAGTKPHLHTAALFKAVSSGQLKTLFVVVAAAR